MTSIKFYSALTSLALSFSLMMNAQEQELPNGATPGWYAQVRSNIQQLQFSFHNGTTASNFNATNQANYLRFQIQPAGYSVQNIKRAATDKTWDIGFSMNGIGRQTITPFSKDVMVINNAEMLTFRHKLADIQYINDEKGLRQNFIVKERP